VSLILPRPVHTPRSGRSTRSGPVRQDQFIKKLEAVGRMATPPLQELSYVTYCPDSTRGVMRPILSTPA
jgi:hypothetical protein